MFLIAAPITLLCACGGEQSGPVMSDLEVLTSASDATPDVDVAAPVLDASVDVAPQDVAPQDVAPQDVEAHDVAVEDVDVALTEDGAVVADAPQMDVMDAGEGDASDAPTSPWSTEGWPEVCMGSSAHCARPYNQLSQVCTHNAMSNGEDGFTLPAPNQAYSFTRQLDDGVRCLMLDTYEAYGEPYLCHAACGIWGQRPLADALDEIALWMTSHPDEVVTFILQSNLAEAVFHQSLVDAGLASASGAPTPDDMLYFHDAPPGSPWPPIGWMLAQNQRLVVFTDDDAANGSWHLDWRVYGWETPYDDPTYTCSPGRGEPTAYDDQIFILNHYTLCIQGGCTSTSIVNNAYDFALERASGCWQVDSANNPWGQIPTFVNVDNYHVPVGGGPTDSADIVEVVEALNALWPGPP